MSSEPTQGTATGIVVGATIGVTIFMILMFTVWHYYSRKMHRPKGMPPLGRTVKGERERKVETIMRDDFCDDDDDDDDGV
ncbi:hypothetical protein DFP73DRAFT_594221 [Morchella snyderi]|nr:hypothetical protein DFP73DRAFT_594221 [Morchella snyderi]